MSDSGATPVIAVYTHTGLLPANLIQAWVAAAQIALTRDFAPHWGDARLVYVPPGGSIQSDWWQLVYFDHSDQAGALGYHDVTSSGQPLGKVFIQDCLDDKENWNVTSDHEIKEMIADPNINQTIPVTIDGIAWEYSREVCLAGDTTVPLSDGSSPLIGELAARGGFSARRTMRDAKTVRVILTDGTSVRCTSDHRFLLANGQFVAAVALRSGDVLPSMTPADAIDRSNVHAITLRVNQGGDALAADEPNGSIGQFRSPASFPPQVSIAVHPSLGGGIHHVRVMGAKEQMIGIHARSDVAGVTDLNAVWDRPFVQLERKTMGRDYLFVVSDLTVTRQPRSDPKPAAIRFVDAYPEFFLKRRSAAVITPSSPVNIAMETLPGPVRRAHSFGSERTSASFDGTRHAKVIDRIEDDGQTEVFDLTVPDHHNFAVGAGVFVHNCDAPEDDRFGLRVAGHVASNFVLPSWFDLAGTAPFTGYPCPEITGPFMLASGGYAGRRQLPNGEWQQEFARVAGPRQIKKPSSRTMRRFVRDLTL